MKIIGPLTDPTAHGGRPEDAFHVVGSRSSTALIGAVTVKQQNKKRKAMIDHIYLPVSDLKRSSEFYKKLLGPLGIDMPYEFGQPPIRGFAINNVPGFWLKNGEVAKDLYIAFTAKSADAVEASYKAAIDAGATSNKEPSLRPEWRADYFAANIGDLDGYNIEIAYKPWLYK